MDGVSTYLALTFGTLLSSQGTEASIETVSPAPPGFPFFVSQLTRPFPARFPLAGFPLIHTFALSRFPDTTRAATAELIGFRLSDIRSGRCFFEIMTHSFIRRIHSE
jgi:hypothetical protein